MDIIRELSIAPIYLGLIYLLAFYIRHLFYKNSPLKKYFLPALTVKLIGAVSLTLVYTYYYDGGDINSYYSGGSVIYEEFYKGNGLKAALDMDSFKKAVILYDQKIYKLIAPSNYMVMRITGLVAITCFNSFLSISLLFGFISFFGMWAMFKVFVSIKPKLDRHFALACLFFPSVFFWGSGILKDTITMSSLAWLFYFIFQTFINRKIKANYIIGVIICSYLIISIKFYIFISFVPVMVFWVFSEFRDKIKSRILRLTLGPSLVLLGLASAYYSIELYFEETGTSYEELVDKSEYQKKALETIDSGSKYEISTFDGSVGSFFTILPQAFVVSVYRPFLWEIKNPFMLLAAMECSLLLFLTYRLFRRKPIEVLAIFKQNKLLLPIFIFVIIFSFGVGTTSGNFGTLVRYRIPLQPFVLASLFILNYTGLNNSKSPKKL